MLIGIVLCLLKMHISLNMSLRVINDESSSPGESSFALLLRNLNLFLSRFSGSAGQAIISKSSAYLITDSRYWLQAQEQLDENWTLIRAGSNGGPKDWIEWIVVSIFFFLFFFDRFKYTSLVGTSQRS